MNIILVYLNDSYIIFVLYEYNEYKLPFFIKNKKAFLYSLLANQMRQAMLHVKRVLYFITYSKQQCVKTHTKIVGYMTSLKCHSILVGLGKANEQIF